MNFAEGAMAVAGMVIITVLTRGAFFLSKRELPFPHWLREGLKYAPLAALAAVVAPQIVMTDGALIGTWRDPRVFAALAGGAWYFWRRDILGTIVAGLVVLLALRLGFGW